MGILEAATQRMKMEEARYEEQIAALKAENERLMKALADMEAKKISLQDDALPKWINRAEAAERALAERAGGVKVLREAALMLLSEIDAASDINSIVGASNPLRKALHALTTEPAEPEGQQEPMPRNVIWFGFDENTGEFTGEYCSVKPADARGMRPYIPYTDRPAEQAVTDAMVEAACLAWINAPSPLEDSMRAALKAAMEAGRHD